MVVFYTWGVLYLCQCSRKVGPSSEVYHDKCVGFVCCIVACSYVSVCLHDSYLQVKQLPISLGAMFTEAF